MRHLWVVGIVAMLIAVASTGFAASRQPKTGSVQPAPDVIGLIHRLEAKLDKIEHKLDAADPEHKRLADMIEELHVLVKHYVEFAVDAHEKQERKLDAAEAKLDRIERAIGIQVSSADTLFRQIARLEAKLDRLEAKADRAPTVGGVE